MMPVVFLATVIAASAPVTQQPATQVVQAAPASPAVASNPLPAAAAPDKAKLICENQEVTGSRLQRRRVCLTSDQWREARRQERLDVEHDQRLGKNGGQ